MSRVSLFKVNFHIYGYFELSEEDYEYKSGNVCEWWCDPNGWSFREILGILKHKGYPKVSSMYYRAGGKLKVLKDDEGAMLMVAESICNGKVDLYVFATHIKCANVWGEGMSADVDVGESSTKRRRLNSFTGDPPCPTLPSDLWLEIFFRLPATSLLRIKSVCKSWRSIIFDPKFAKNHFRVSTKRHHVLFLSLIRFPRDHVAKARSLSSAVAATTHQVEYPLQDRRNQLFDSIVGSCHDILCLHLFRFCYYSPRSIVLWNPFIRECRELPSLEGTLVKVPADTNYGFGYDASTETYKVVAVSYTKNCHGLYDAQTHVHTMGTDVWRRIQDFPCTVRNLHPGIFVSGNLNFFDKFNRCSIISMDLEKESFRSLVVPIHIYELCVLSDCLSIISYDRDGYVSTMDVWLMKEYGNEDSWTRVFRVPGESFWSYDRVLFSEDDELLVETFSKKLFVCNARDGTQTRDLEIKKYHRLMAPEVFEESLISPCTYQ